MRKLNDLRRPFAEAFASLNAHGLTDFERITLEAVRDALEKLYKYEIEYGEWLELRPNITHQLPAYSEDTRALIQVFRTSASLSVGSLRAGVDLYHEPKAFVYPSEDEDEDGFIFPFSLEGENDDG